TDNAPLTTGGIGLDTVFSASCLLPEKSGCGKALLLKFQPASNGAFTRTVTKVSEVAATAVPGGISVAVKRNVRITSSFSSTGVLYLAVTVAEPAAPATRLLLLTTMSELATSAKRLSETRVQLALATPISSSSSKVASSCILPVFSATTVATALR